MLNPNPAIRIVIASETKQSLFFAGDCHAPSGARNDRLNKALARLSLDLG